MKTQRTFKLIDGTFSASEAHAVLTAVVSAKINFHSLKQFSDTIRFGSDKMQSEQRISELHQLSQELNDFTEEAEKHGRRLKIQALIGIEFEANEENTA